MPQPSRRLACERRLAALLLCLCLFARLSGSAATFPLRVSADHRFLEDHQGRPFLVWVMGGDFAVPRSDRWTGNALAEGLREGGARQLMTAHGGQTTALATFGDQPWLGIDSVYSYRPDLYKPLLANAARQPRRPFILIETIYEGEHHSTPDQIRWQAWWSILCGATGQFFGNNPIWHFDGPTLFPFQGTWQQALSSAGSRDMARLGRFFRALPWQRLRPDTGRKIIIEGSGSGPNRAIAAATSDGTLAVIYVPSSATARRRLTLRLAGLGSPLRAYWFDPAEAGKAGSKIEVVGHDQQVFATPGNNGAGANDWVLVLETRDNSGLAQERPRAASAAARMENTQ